MTYLRTGPILSATLALSAISLPPAFAQEGSGLTGTLTFSQGFEISDNEDLDSATSGSTFTSRTGLGFGAQSVTRVETLSLELGTEIVGDYGGGARDSFEIENTTASATYERRGANSALAFSARYSERDLGDTVTTLGVGSGSGTLVIDDGTAAVTTLDASVEVGTEGPFGFRLGAGYLNEDFSGTTDPDLVDRERINVDGLARFRINPAFAVRALAGFSSEDEAGVAVDTDTSYVGLGVEGSSAGGLSYSGDILYDRLEDAGGEEDGVGIDLSVTQDRPTGSIGADFSSRIDEDGRRTEASVRRSVTLATGDLAFSLGLVDLEGDTSLRPKGSLSYSRTLKSAELTASLTQNPSIDGASVYSNTSLELGYSQAINATSGWSAALGYSAANEIGGGDDDERATARVTYTQSLTADWEMNAGVQHVREIDAGGPSESSNTLFFNIQRDITFGF